MKTKYHCLICSAEFFIEPEEYKRCPYCGAKELDKFFVSDYEMERQDEQASISPM